MPVLFWETPSPVARISPKNPWIIELKISPSLTYVYCTPTELVEVLVVSWIPIKQARNPLGEKLKAMPVAGVYVRTVTGMPAPTRHTGLINVTPAVRLNEFGPMSI